MTNYVLSFRFMSLKNASNIVRKRSNPPIIHMISFKMQTHSHMQINCNPASNLKNKYSVCLNPADEQHEKRV